MATPIQNMQDVWWQQQAPKCLVAATEGYAFDKLDAPFDKPLFHKTQADKEQIEHAERVAWALYRGDRDEFWNLVGIPLRDRLDAMRDEEESA